jgi:hypothetical protein
MPSAPFWSRRRIDEGDRLSRCATHLRYGPRLRGEHDAAVRQVPAVVESPNQSQAPGRTQTVIGFAAGATTKAVDNMRRSRNTDSTNSEVVMLQSIGGLVLSAVGLMFVSILLWRVVLRMRERRVR